MRGRELEVRGAGIFGNRAAGDLGAYTGSSGPAEDGAKPRPHTREHAGRSYLKV